jgi:serine/threonine-protein kinase
MSTAELVSELLLRWEELREGGQAISAEELCRDCPDLVDEVRRRIATLEAVYRVPNRLPADTRPDAERQPDSGAPRVPGYEVLGELGSGGMGVVYKARDARLKRLVALKMILSGPHARPEERERFRREAEAVARLQHPNVVQIYEVGEQDGRPYLALEYVGGGSLAGRLGGRPLPPDDAARLVRSLALAVHAAHLRGIVHRDLKPANVLLTEDGTPKVTDFGLAKRLDEAGQTQTGAVLGTPNYMAPEQALGDSRAVGPHTDVHALGAILYELLTGRPPFEGATLLETLDQVRSQDPPPPGRLRPGMPRDLETICRKCLEKEPARRYASAQALADDLGRYLDGQLIHARSFTLADRLARTLNRDQEIHRFRAFRPVALCMASVPFLSQLLPFLFLRDTWFYPAGLLVVSLAFVAAAMAGFFWLNRNGALIPHAALSHQQFWSLRIGHYTGMALAPVVCRQLFGAGETWALATYPFWAIVTGSLLFTMGGALWGRLYLAGLALLGTAALMPLRLEWAPVEFGLVVSVIGAGIALRLYRRDAAGAPGGAAAPIPPDKGGGSPSGPSPTRPPTAGRAGGRRCAPGRRA